MEVLALSADDVVGPLSLYRHAIENKFKEGRRYEVALLLMGAERELLSSLSTVLSAHSLTRAQWSVLTILDLTPAGQVPLGQIAVALRVHGTTITNAVDRLAGLGLVERAQAPEDRRSVLGVITDEGRRISTEILTELAAMQFGLSVLTDSDIDHLARILGKLAPYDVLDERGA